MNDTMVKHAASVSMTSKEFQQLSEFIHREVGIKLPPTKKTMLEARLQKRVRMLRMSGFKEYYSYLFSETGLEEELQNLIDVVTTNTTDFFREPRHFEYLSSNVLPEWCKRGGGQAFSLWSAGCSSGMEPYTLAMVLSEFAETRQGFSFNIVATDISMDMLRTAQRGIYDEEKVVTVPHHMKRKYLLRSKDRNRGLVRITPELRRMIAFRRLNFMEEFRFERPLDVIFCRNVIIYFDRPTQELLFQRFCRYLKPGGNIFIGHSESLTGMDLPLEQVAPTIYRKI